MGSAEQDFVNLGTAAEIAGLSHDTISRRVRTGVLPVYQSNADRRVRLIRVADLETMTTPIRGETA